jgi:dolichol-phosphate mannosyltransferase
VVDDASPDGTQEIAKQLAKVYGEHRVVSESCLDLSPADHRYSNLVRESLDLGESHSLDLTHRRTAYVHGINFCSGNFVIIMDADFSHHVSSCAPLD